MEHDETLHLPPETQALLALIARLPDLTTRERRLVSRLAYGTEALQAFASEIRRARRAFWAVGLALIGACFGGVTLFGVLSPIVLLGLGFFACARGVSNHEVLGGLQPLSRCPDDCASALALIERSSWAAQWRDAVVKSCRELTVADFWQMSRLERGQRQQEEKATHEATCRKLHGLT